MKCEKTYDNIEPKTDAELLGEVIRNCRKDRKMTQQQLASSSGVNESYLSAVEHGYSYVSLSKYLNICEGLEVDPLEIMHSYLIARAERGIDDTEGERLEQDESGWFLGQTKA